MELKDIPRGRRSRSARVRRQIRGNTPNMPAIPSLRGKAMAVTSDLRPRRRTRVRRRVRAVRVAGRRAARNPAVNRAVRAVDWPALGGAALMLAAPPRRRRTRTLVVVTAGALGAGAAAAAVARRKSGRTEQEPGPSEDVRSDRDPGGPTSAGSTSGDFEATGGSTGTTAGSVFEPHR